MTKEALLDDVLSYIHNYFARDQRPVSGCEIAGGALPFDMPEGVWYRIEGSLLNDGMHQAGSEEVLADETFDGTITLCAVPKPLLETVDQILAWTEKNGDSAYGPYQSESFGGYSYTLKGSSTSNGTTPPVTGWKAAFAGSFTRWRKLS
jgi:hypothetical protein